MRTALDAKVAVASAVLDAYSRYSGIIFQLRVEPAVQRGCFGRDEHEQEHGVRREGRGRESECYVRHM